MYKYRYINRLSIICYSSISCIPFWLRIAFGANNCGCAQSWLLREALEEQWPSSDTTIFISHKLGCAQPWCADSRFQKPESRFWGLWL